MTALSASPIIPASVYVACFLCCLFWRRLYDLPLGKPFYVGHKRAQFTFTSYLDLLTVKANAPPVFGRN